MTLLHDLAAALEGMTPSEVRDSMTPLVDLPWMTVMKIDTPNGTLYNVHLDPDSAETEDCYSANEYVPLGAVLNLRSRDLRTLGSSREHFYQYVVHNA